MPKVTPDQLEKRREEILDACEKIYRSKGFFGVTMKDIGAEITCTRPAIYRYFETKEEILLGLLVREYQGWLEELTSVKNCADTFSREELSAAIASTLKNHDVLLRIQNMNLCEIEQNSRIEKLTEFKILYQKLTVLFTDILRCYSPKIEDRTTEPISLTFFAFLFGVYPFVFHTEKQLESMRLAGVVQTDVSIYDMVYNCLVRILPEK